MTRETELKHYGVRGMKWGIRKSNYNSITTSKRTPHDDHTRAFDGKNAYELSDQELKSRNNRLQAEAQYTKMTRQRTTGQKAVHAIISSGKTVAALYGAYQTYEKIGKRILNNVI